MKTLNNFNKTLFNSINLKTILFSIALVCFTQIGFGQTTISIDFETANDKSFPTDARLIWYVVDGVECIDLTRCNKVSKMFDMYYDRYGKGSVQRIDFGYGSINPKLWGNKPKEQKKRK